MNDQNPAGIRQQVERELRGRLSDTEWQYFVDERYIEEIELGVLTVSDVVERIRSFRTIFGASRQSSGEKPPVLPRATAARQAALGAIYAAQANDDRNVVRVRGLIGALTETQVRGWVAATHYANLDLAPDASQHDEEMAIAHRRVQGEPTETLFYLDGRARRLLTVLDPLLIKLARLSHALSERWRFPKEEATNFVLTGRVPTVLRFHVEPRVHMSVNNATSRIMMELDPDMTPLEVAEVYRKMRGVIKGDRSRVRPVSEHTAVLAGWIVNRETDETWRAARLAWNSEFPEWTSHSNTNFARDAHAAVKRLAHPGWQLSSGLT